MRTWCGEALPVLCAAALVGVVPHARAETDIIKILRGAGGVGFPPLLIMEQKGLIERKAREPASPTSRPNGTSSAVRRSSTISCCRAPPTS
jgi:hypothetical protein